MVKRKKGLAILVGAAVGLAILVAAVAILVVAVAILVVAVVMVKIQAATEAAEVILVVVVVVVKVQVAGAALMMVTLPTKAAILMTAKASVHLRSPQRKKVRVALRNLPRIPGL